MANSRPGETVPYVLFYEDFVCYLLHYERQNQNIPRQETIEPGSLKHSIDLR